MQRRIFYLEPDISVICNKDRITSEGCKGSPDWMIVDFEKNRITVYDFQRDSLEEYTFSDKVRAGIYDDFEIDFSEISIK